MTNLDEITPCDVCGNVELNWDRDWAVSDEEWQQVVPEKWRDKTLCPWCFVRFAEERGKHYGVIYYPWDPSIAIGVKRVQSSSYGMSLDAMRRELRGRYERLSKNLEFRVKETPGLTRYKPHAQKLVWMPPERFLELVPEPGMWSEDHIRYLKHAMLRGEEIEPLFVDVFSDTCKVWRHEGRHRARAAMELGIKKVPVIIYCLSPQGGFTDYSECEPCDTERLKRWGMNPVEERRLPLDGDVWRAIREQGLGLESVGAYWVYEDGVGYVLLKFKPGIREEYVQRVASAVRQLGYNVRVRRG